MVLVCQMAGWLGESSGAVPPGEVALAGKFMVMYGAVWATGLGECHWGGTSSKRRRQVADGCGNGLWGGRLGGYVGRLGDYVREGVGGGVSGAGEGELWGCWMNGFSGSHVGWRMGSM